VGGDQRLPGHVGAHAAVSQDKMGQDREDGFAGGALNPPDSEAAEADTRIMGVARQASTAVTGRLVFQLKAEGEDERQDTFDVSDHRGSNS
jgi:hypothetical protein